MHIRLLAPIMCLLAGAPLSARERPPIIDMHMHALAADSQGRGRWACARPSRAFRPGTSDAPGRSNSWSGFSVPRAATRSGLQ